MKFHSLIISIFATVIFFTLSCTKNSNNDAITPGPFPTLLAKLFLIDTTFPAPKDTVTRVSFSYDNLNRLSEATIISSDLNGENPSTTIKQIDYNGSDRFASRLRRTFISSLNKKSFDTSYYSYSNDRFMRDSSFISGMSYIAKFAYQSDTIELNNRGWLMPGSYSFTDTSNIYLVRMADNIIYQKDTLIRQVDTSAALQYYTTETVVSYLPNSNPFYKINPVKKEYFTDIGIGTYADAGYAPQFLISEQGLTRKTWTSNHPEKVNYIRNERITYLYTFRADGYPLEAWVGIHLTNTAHLRRKMLFIYKD